MSKAITAIIATILVIFLALGVAGGLILSHRNTSVALEEKVKAQYNSNKSNYDSMWKKVKEMTQVTDMQAEQFKDVFTATISGRYQDTNLLFKAIKEDNPKLSSEVYTSLQREIAAGRILFDKNQQKLQDVIREYNTYIKVHFIMAAITGRTPIDGDQYLVTSDRTIDAFNSKKDDVIDLKK